MISGLWGGWVWCEICAVWVVMLGGGGGGGGAILMIDDLKLKELLRMVPVPTL